MMRACVLSVSSTAAKTRVSLLYRAADTSPMWVKCCAVNCAGIARSSRSCGSKARLVRCSALVPERTNESASGSSVTPCGLWRAYIA
eukprot:1821411-Rhodomonas_salina.1